MQSLVERGTGGYSLRDWALFQGASGNLANTDFEINRPNRGGNLWKPLSAKLPKNVGKWGGSASEASGMLRRVARFFGADDVGFCGLDRRWVYSHYFDEETGRDFPIRFTDEPGLEGYREPTQLADGTQVIPKEMQHIVVMLFEMDRDGINAAPTLIGNATTQAAYSRISFTTVMTAEFIRGLGYHAIPSANCTALNIPLTIDAGLGQLGRNAKLITPQFGPRCRIAKVITDMPLEAGEPMDFGVTEFCDSCMKCARKCPAQAIPSGERSYEPINECNNAGVLQWQVDHKKCVRYMSEVGTNCSICIKVCPFNKGKNKIHNVSRWFIKNLRWSDPLFIWLDDALGYGNNTDTRTFWASIS